MLEPLVHVYRVPLPGLAEHVCKKSRIAPPPRLLSFQGFALRFCSDLTRHRGVELIEPIDRHLRRAHIYHALLHRRLSISLLLDRILHLAFSQLQGLQLLLQVLQDSGGYFQQLLPFVLFVF